MVVFLLSRVLAHYPQEHRNEITSRSLRNNRCDQRNIGPRAQAPVAESNANIIARLLDVEDRNHL